MLLHRRLQPLGQLVDRRERPQRVRALAVRARPRVAADDQQRDRTDDERRQRDVEQHVAHRPQRLGDADREPVPVAHRRERRDRPVERRDVALRGRVEVLQLRLVAADPGRGAELGVVRPRQEEHAARGPVRDVEHEHQVARDGDRRQRDAQVVLEVLEEDADAVEADQSQEAQEHKRAGGLGARPDDGDHDVVKGDQREHVDEEERADVPPRDHPGRGD